jgi:hypothetical protein
MRNYNRLVSEKINATPADVWDAITRKTGIMFIGAEVETDWQAGHVISFKGEWEGKRYEDKGVVEIFERHRKLAFTPPTHGCVVRDSGNFAHPCLLPGRVR